MNYRSQQEIDELIACGKAITQAPSREMKEYRGSHRNDMVLVSVDGRYRFKVFMRVSMAFVENFSAGMDLLEADGSRLPLMRCNGPHEGFSAEPGDPNRWHRSYHIHRADAAALAEGRDPLCRGMRTNAYSDLDGAIRHLLESTGVSATDVVKYFPRKEWTFWE